MKKFLLFMTAVLLTVMYGYSQAPGMFNYQGVARNSVGNVLVNKNITLRITIHDGAAAGPVVYQETRAAITNPFGLFNVQVGSPGAITTVGTIAAVPWNLGTKHIQVEIDPNGGSTFINIGTAQVASVPYALYSNLAGDLVLPFNKTQADAGTLFKITNSGSGSGSTALEGLTNSTANNVSAIIGTVTPTGAGSSSTGVRGINNGTAGLGIGVWGSQNGTGWGVYGQTPGGRGVYGSTTTGTGVYGDASSGVGVYGISSTGRAGFFENTNAANTAEALFVTTNGSGHAITGMNSGTGRGGFFSVTNPASTADAVRAETNGTGASWGIRAISSGTNGAGLFQQTNATNTSNNVQSNQAGLGRAGFFVVNNAANAANTVEITHNGLIGGRALVASNSGFGATADLGISNTTNVNNVLQINHLGLGRGALIQSTNPANPANIIDAATAGTGWVANLQSTNVTPRALRTAGALQFTGIGETANWILTSDATGNATWLPPAPASDLVLPFDKTQAENGFLFRLINSGNSTPSSAIEGVTNSTASSAYAIRGVVADVAPGGFSAAVRGANNGTGGLGIGVWGSQGGSGWGVYGVTPNGLGVYGNSTGSGFGVFGNSTDGIGVFGTSANGHASQFDITNPANTGDAVRANQNGLGRGVYSQINNTSNIVAAVRGETNGGGYGIFGQATGNGNAAFFQVSNPSSTSSTVNVTTNGIGSGITVQLTNAGSGARGIDVLNAGVGTAGFAVGAGGTGWWGITSSISAAGILGDNTFGEAVVGRNRGGNGVGAVVGRNDSTGYGVRGFNTMDGIGVLGQGGISGGTSRGGLFENVNSTNPTTVLEARGNGTGASLVVANSNVGVVNLAIFRKGGANVVRIADDGEIFANGGFTIGGADIAEYFEVEGARTSYEEGDVLVISQTSDRKVERSSEPYSTLISGVFATKPGVKLTERNATDGSFDDMVPMGVIGVVPTKVCLEGGAIKRGDLLVTSSIPGVAMKADPDKVKVGQVLGKSLQDYNAEGVGKINVLVSIK